MPEYNPINELVKKQYEEALLHGKYRDPKTVKAVWNHINQFEDFTGYMDFKTFSADQAKSFKMWLEKQKNKKGCKRLAFLWRWLCGWKLCFKKLMG